MSDKETLFEDEGRLYKELRDTWPEVVSCMECDYKMTYEEIMDIMFLWLVKQNFYCKTDGSTPPSKDYLEFVVSICKDLTEGVAETGVSLKEKSNG